MSDHSEDDPMMTNGFPPQLVRKPKSTSPHRPTPTKENFRPDPPPSASEFQEEKTGRDPGDHSGFTISGFDTDTPPIRPIKPRPELEALIQSEQKVQRNQPVSEQKAQRNQLALEGFDDYVDPPDTPVSQFPPSPPVRTPVAHPPETRQSAPVVSPGRPAPVNRVPRPPQPSRPVIDDHNITQVGGKREEGEQEAAPGEGIGMYSIGPQSQDGVWQLRAFHSLSDGEPWKFGKHIFQISQDATGQHHLQALSKADGIFEKLAPNAHYEIMDGTRFRLGNYVIEYRNCNGLTEPSPEECPRGGVFAGRFLASEAFLDILGPDEKPCLSFPLIYREVTTLGRGGTKGDLTCDMTLPDEEVLLSRLHVMILQKQGQTYLVDLGSKNGTFIWRPGTTSIMIGTARNAESATQILSGEILIRFVGA